MKFVQEMGAGGMGGGPPTNNAGGGQIAGIGVGKYGEPGGTASLLFKKKKHPKVFNRKVK